MLGLCARGEEAPCVPWPPTFQTKEEYQAELNEACEDPGFAQWLAKRRAPKRVFGEMYAKRQKLLDSCSGLRDNPKYSAVLEHVQKWNGDVHGVLFPDRRLRHEDGIDLSLLGQDPNPNVLTFPSYTELAWGKSIPELKEMYVAEETRARREEHAKLAFADALLAANKDKYEALEDDYGRKRLAYEALRAPAAFAPASAAAFAPAAAAFGASSVSEPARDISF